MTARCMREPVRFRRLDDYALSQPALDALQRLHAALDLAGMWAVRRRRRRTLAGIAALGDRIMLDLGFDPDELRAEAAKPFWRS